MAGMKSKQEGTCVIRKSLSLLSYFIKHNRKQKNEQRRADSTRKKYRSRHWKTKTIQTAQENRATLHAGRPASESQRDYKQTRWMHWGADNTTHCAFSNNNCSFNILSIDLSYSYLSIPTLVRPMRGLSLTLGTNETFLSLGHKPQTEFMRTCPLPFWLWWTRALFF